MNTPSLILVLLTVQQVKSTSIPGPMCVWRRFQGRDIVYTDTECSQGMPCPSAQPTYLISNETCVSDQYLVTQCSLQLVQTEDSTLTDTITAVVIQNGFLSVFTTPSTTVPVQVVYYNQTGRSLGNCSLVSLEVYRGEGASIDISHRGFTITGGNLTIQVEEGELAYDRADYEGELYRMNVSCDDIIEDCLFFKLQRRNQSAADAVFEAKFDCTVPGTGGNKTSCSTTTTTGSMELVNNETMTTNATVTATAPETTPETTSATTDGNTLLQYVVFATGGSIGGLILVILLLCVVVGCLVRRKRKNYVITTTQNITTPAEETDQAQSVATNTEATAAAHSVEQQVTVSEQRENTAPSGRQREPSNSEDHTYATVIEPPRPIEVSLPRAPQTTNPMIVQTEITMATTDPLGVENAAEEDPPGRESKEDDPDFTFDTFKPKPKPRKERPSSCKVEHDDLDQVQQSTPIQVYEPVTNIKMSHSPNSKPAEEYDQLVHDKSMKPRHYSVPSSVQYSQLNKQEPTEHRKHSGTTKPDTMADIKSGYSVLVASSRHSRDCQPSPPPLPPPLNPNDSILRKKPTIKTYKFIYNSSSDEEDDTPPAGVQAHPPLYDQPTSLSLILAKNPSFKDDTEDVGDFGTSDKQEEPIYDLPPSSPLLSSQDSYVDMQGHHIHRV